MRRARMFAIACGYEDAKRFRPSARRSSVEVGLRLSAEERTGPCSRPTLPRLENTPSRREIAWLMRTMVALYCSSYAKPPAAVTLDIDDTVDVVHGHQQLSLLTRAL
jgi:hypothetical protein